MMNTRTVGMLLLAAVAALAATLTGSAAARADASNGVIASSGPLTRVAVSDDLNCAVNHADDTAGEFFGDTACATLIAVDGTLYGPADIPAGGNAAPRTPWTAVGQTSSGAGTDSDPYRVETHVQGGPLDVTELDTYVAGVEYYGTKVTVTNDTDSAKEITLYRAGDCYLQNSDLGFGAVDVDAHAVACTASQAPDARIQQWAPLTADAHYVESRYSTVWSIIGSQQPFPDTCGCDIYQDNGAGLSWTVTLAPHETRSFNHLTSFSPDGSTDVSDSDGDSFPDTWEQPDGGVDTDGDGTPDLKLSDYGATPDKKDVFVQVGWTRSHSCALVVFFCSDTNHRPSLGALRDVQDAFGRHGIRLHVDAGADSVMNPDTGARWGSRTAVRDAVAAPTPIPGYARTTGTFDWTVAFDGYKQQLMPSARRRIFHFALYVGQHEDGHVSASGEARPNLGTGLGAGADFVLSGDVAFFGDDGMDRLEEAGTFMHELGHNLGLSHGGPIADAAMKFKPNYPSLMSYLWQGIGVPKYSSLHLLDYSDGTLDPLDGTSMSEADGLAPDLVASDIGTSWICPNGRQHDTVPSMSNVDWNCSGDASVPVRSIYPSWGTMSDHDDWEALVFDGNGALGGNGDAGSAPATTPVQDVDPAEEGIALLSHQAVSVTGPGLLTMQAGTDATVELTLVNPHADARTYEVETVSDGLATSGLPRQLTLTPGETKLALQLHAGAPADAAFAEIDVTETGDPTDADTAQIEARIVSPPATGNPGAPGSTPRRQADGRKRRTIRCVASKPRRTLHATLGQRHGRHLAARAAKPIGNRGRTVYRVRLTRRCTVLATGTARGDTLALTLKPTGTRFVRRHGRRVAVKVYPRLRGTLVLRPAGRGPRIAAAKIVFSR